MKIPIYRTVDKWLGVPLCVVLGGISKLFPKQKIKSPKRIAVLKLWAIGDSVVSLPMIRSLKQSFPAAKIDVVARKRNAAAFENNRDINKIVLFEPGSILAILSMFRKYDLVIDAEPWMRLSALLSMFIGRRRVGFGGQARSIAYTDTISFDRAKHMVKNYLEMARKAEAKKLHDKLVPIVVSEQDKKAVDKFVKENKLAGAGKIVGIAPGAAESARSRMWAGERFAEVADKLAEKYKAKIVFFGSPGEKQLIGSIQNQMRHNSTTQAGKLSLKQTFELVRRCKLFISNDAGLMHVAAAQGVKTIGLFGPNTPSLWAPYGKGNISIYHKLACSPCIINDKGQAPDCLRKQDKYLCMRLITVDDVLDAVKKCLRK